MSNGYAHNERALAHVHAVQAYDHRLEDEAASSRPDRDELKRLNSKIGVGLKLAEVHALLAIADAIDSGAVDRLAAQLPRHTARPLTGDNLG